MPNRAIVFVFKDDHATALMQQFDVFEKFKFIGKLIEAEQSPSHHHMTAAQILHGATAKQPVSNFVLVGIIIPNVEAAFLPGYKVYSDGTKWATLKDLCKRYFVDLEVPCT